MSDQKNHFAALDLFYKQCSALAEQIDAKQDEIHTLFSDYQTWEVTDHEIQSSVQALHNVQVEYDGFEQPEAKLTVSCYLPVNMPLYSLILYAILPSYYFETVYIRPGASLNAYIPALIDILGLASLGFDQVAVKDLPAKLFTDLYAKDSEVILFTGKYENALMLEKTCTESLLVFEGTGPCPFFVSETASVKDVQLAAQKAVAIRCFNSGQDCIAPDVIFVHKDKLKDFTGNLIENLKAVKVGDSKDKAVRVAHTIKEKYLFAIEKWLEKNRQQIIFGGEIDTKQLIVHPTVLSRDIKQHKGTFKELFAPVFYILYYEDVQSVLEIINADSFKARSMYACMFGEDAVITKNLSLCTVLKNTTVNDQEDGNQPYGGYGPLANFVSYKGKRKARPLLISRDVRDWMLAHQSSNLPHQALQVA